MIKPASQWRYSREKRFNDPCGASYFSHIMR